MGKLTVRRSDGSTLEVRTTRKTKSIDTSREKPVFVDLSEIGDMPALVDTRLSYETSLEQLDLTALTSAQTITARVAKPIDLAPLARCSGLTSVTFRIDDGVLDFTPLHGHPTLARVAIDCTGNQAAFDLAFARELPTLTSLSLAGGEWRSLDLEPLRGLPLQSLTLHRQYIATVDFTTIAQPALEHLMLQELEIREPYLDLSPLAVCTQLRFLSLLGAEVGTLEVSGLAKLARLTRFDPPNVKSMMMAPQFEPIVAPGLARWRNNIGVE